MDDYGLGSSGIGDSQGGNQGGNDGSGQGSGSSGMQTTQGQYDAQTTEYQSAPTSEATPTTTSESQTNSASPSSTSSSSNGLSPSTRTAIIAGVLGGIGALLIISLIAVYVLQKRKIKKSKRVTQQVSYNGLNASFAGVPFLKRNSHLSDSEISPPPMVADTSYHGAYMRGGHSNYPDLSSDMETDRFLPTYEETQQRMSATTHISHTPSDYFVSPVTTRDPFTDQYRLSNLSQMSQNAMSPPRPGPLVRHDTMGFPLDDGDTSYIGPDGQQHRLSRMMHSPHNSIPESTIISPAPIRPNTSHEDLERGVLQNEDPQPNPHAPQPQPQHLNSLSSNYDNPYEFENEDDTVPPLNLSFGGERTMSPASMQPGGWIAAHNPHLAAGFSGGVRRNTSQRTESSFAPSVVSDTELDRLGVGRSA